MTRFDGMIFAGTAERAVELQKEVEFELDPPAPLDAVKTTVLWGDGRAVAYAAQPVAEFMRAVHPGDDGCLELRAFRDGTVRTVFVPLPLTDERVREIIKTCDEERSRDIYHAVATRRDRTSGRLANCTLLHALYIEIDFKRGVPLRDVWAGLTGFALPPSAVVHSGGGLHVYWLLREPIDLGTDLGVSRAYAWLGALAARLGGEPESAEPARVLRVPTTRNLKPAYGPRPPVVTLLAYDWSRRYSLAEAQAALGDPQIVERPAAAPPPIDHGMGAPERVERARAWLKDEAPAVEGDGGDARTFEVACAVAVGHDLDEDGALLALRDWNARCEPPWTERELRQKVRNATRYATEQRGARLADYQRTDSGNAEFFADRHGDRVCHDHARRQWLWFDGQRWTPNRTAEVDRLALEAVRRRQELATLIADADKRKAALKWATESENRPRRDNLMALAAKVERLAVSGDEWDADPWLLGVASGVVDLRTGALRDGRPADRITKQAPPAFDPAARAPRFERFMEEIFAGHPELPGYLQRAIGYALTGITTEQVFWILYGEGANGKSTLIEAIFHHVLGERDYAWAMPFPEAGWSNAMSEYQKAGLVGRRFVTASEVKRRGQINEELVKSLTGDDTINARHPYGRPFQFRPVAKFFLRVNAKPIIRDETHGMWRRVKLIPFTRTFAVDKTLPETLAAEASGILAWAVRGCLDWQREGLREPAAVKAATEEYRSESDPLADFLAERCVVEAGKQAGGREAFRAYCEWADARHLPADARLTQTAFGTRMKERFPDVGKRTVVYSGLGLLSRVSQIDDF